MEFENNQNKTNPLEAYFRQPKIYVSLPSKGKWYPPGTLNIPASGELGIMSMTMKDEITLKTPDALMNGQGVVDVIKSCVDGIKDPWTMPIVDVDLILIAIKIASYGNDIDMTSHCPKCGEVSEFTVPLDRYIDNASILSFKDQISIGDFVVSLIPPNYKKISEFRIKIFENRRQIINLQNMEGDESEIKKIQDDLTKQINEDTLELMLITVNKIITPDKVQVTEKTFIREFLLNAESAFINKILETFEENNNTLTIPSHDALCDKCDHKWQLPIRFDQSDFFA